MNSNVKQKVVVAMSGGVDSAVAAILLRKEGFKVTGVFLNLADSPQLKEGEKSARKIANAFKIPFFVLDFRKEFRKKVIEYFLEEIKKGRTPNPCVVCNKEIKLGLLLNKALKLGENYVATGHYAKRQEGKNKKQEVKLLKAKDKNKDQSYFLWQLRQNQLKHILFPLGNFTKLEVRKLARKFKISALVRPESNDICFIQITTGDFLKRNIRAKPGKIVNSKGEVIGYHQGLFFYTIGQRKGIRIGGEAKPFYVLGKNLRKNILVVTQNQKDLYKKELVAEKVNWISGKAPKLPLRARVKIRYRHKGELATLDSCSAKGLRIVFEKPQKAITPGQSAVFYLKQNLLGGGIIK